MTDCKVIWNAWARKELVPRLNTIPFEAPKFTRALYCGWCQVDVHGNAKTCPHCDGPLVISGDARMEREK
jgi:hypothetical protein